MTWYTKLFQDSSHVEKYHISCTFLHALQIRSPLPGCWRTKISHHAKPFFLPKLLLFPPNKGGTELLDKTSKFIYFSILPSKFAIHSFQEKWNDTIPANPNQDDIFWQSIYKIPFQCLRETKLQSFQFKILYRIIPCNQYLKQLRNKEHDCCDYCNDQDTIVHFLYNCQKVQSPWSQFCSWFERETQINLKVSPQEYLLGVTCNRHNVKVVNTLLL